MKPLVFLTIILITAISCNKENSIQERHTNTLVSRADSAISAYTAKGDYSNALSCAYRMDSISSAANDKEGELLATAYIGQCYLAMDLYDSCNVYFERSHGIWEKIKNSAPTKMHTRPYMSCITVLESMR